MNKFVALTVAVALIFIAIVLFSMFDIVVVKGNEVGVKETWSKGVLNDPLPPKTYFTLPWEKIFVYPTSVQVFVMNDKQDDAGEGRKQDSYLVQSKDNQDMHLSLQVQWRIDPAHVIELHKQVGSHGIEEKVLRPTMLRTVKDEATTREAIEAYSGVGLVQLQQDIEKSLSDPQGELRQRGIVVDSFVIEHIKLDNEFVAEIQARQVAMQRELRSIQETKAAEAEALKAKAIAQADLNKAVVEAQRDKEVAVLQAEAENEKTILAAEAEKQKVVLAAEAEKESGELKAAAILAIGKATAEAEKLKFAAYSADGAETYARIEIAKSMGQSFSNIKGYLPENMSIYTLGTSFMNAVENIVEGKKNE